MKKALLVFSSLVFVVLMLPGMIRPPGAVAIDNRLRVRDLAHALSVALEEYRLEFGSYPEGSAGEMMQALRGENEKNRVFFDCPPEALNERGELLDPWGTPFRITFDHTRKTPKIRSAGPNRIMDEHTPHARLVSDDFHLP